MKNYKLQITHHKQLRSNSNFEFRLSHLFGIWDFEFGISQTNGGFTLTEVVITTGILALIMLGVGAFQENIFGYHTALSRQLVSQHESRRAIEQIIAELRTASHAGNGAFPIEQAQGSSLVFFGNIDRDAGIERVRYFLSGNNLVRGQIDPSGVNPVVYTGPESTATIVQNVINGATALFTYYDDTYGGGGSPLPSPTNIPDIRFVQVTLLIDKDPNRVPAALRTEGGVSIRNVKDNL